MSVKYLYYTESPETGGSLSTAEAVPLLDQLLLMYGGEFMCIHPAEVNYKPTSAEQYPTLDDAQVAYSSHTWIYLDQDAPTYMDELDHPSDNVVYVVGHDLTGYGDESLVGRRYKVRTRIPNFEGHAIICLSVVCIDRWIRSR